jgi:hypothetical protein
MLERGMHALGTARRFRDIDVTLEETMPFTPRSFSRMAAALALALAACADAPDEPFAEHEEPEDYVVEKAGVRGLPASFDRDHVMDDDFFTNEGAVTAADVQAFLEDTPYGRPSFLARERVNGRLASEAIAAAGQAYGINPIVLLARMQVEKSLVGKSTRPSANSVDYAFGCGCPDGRACNRAYRGLDKQLECAAETLRRHYDGSADGSSPWVRGVSRRTLDGLRVVPDNHATASLYSYTPWVLTGRGGNWLVWNVTTKYARAFQETTGIHEPGEDVAPGGGGGEVETPPEAPDFLRAEWIGDACTDDRSCQFANGSAGLCTRWAGATTGICTVSCEGLCPDLAGHGSTFCVSASLLGGDEGGYCARKPGADNDFCADVPGLTARSASRYLGDSSAAARTAEVCLPR